MAIFKLCIWGREIQKLFYILHIVYFDIVSMMSICPITDYANFDHLCRLVSAVFLHSTVTLSPFKISKYFVMRSLEII